MNYLGYQNQGFQNQPYRNPYPNPNIGIQFNNPSYNGHPTGPPRYGVSLPGMTPPSAPSYTGSNSFNDPTLQAGASGSYGGGGSVPEGAIPVPTMGYGNANLMYKKGYRKQMIGGKWYLIPPTQGQALLNGAPPQYNFTPTGGY